MFTVNVEKECGCFRRSDLENNVQLESKDEALLLAQNMKNQMNDEFCGKHEFEVAEMGNSFVIKFAAEPQSSGCCGGGCGH